MSEMSVKRLLVATSIASAFMASPVFAQSAQPAGDPAPEAQSPVAVSPALAAFRADPSSLLTKYPLGGLALETEIINILSADPAAAAQLMAVLADASPTLGADIVSGLEKAEQRLASDPAQSAALTSAIESGVQSVVSADPSKASALAGLSPTSSSLANSIATGLNDAANAIAATNPAGADAISQAVADAPSPLIQTAYSALGNTPATGAVEGGEEAGAGEGEGIQTGAAGTPAPGGDLGAGGVGGDAGFDAAAATGGGAGGTDDGATNDGETTTSTTTASTGSSGTSNGGASSGGNTSTGGGGGTTTTPASEVTG